MSYFTDHEQKVLLVIVVVLLLGCLLHLFFNAMPTQYLPAVPRIAKPLITMININLAKQEELEKLPGIGQSLAYRIIDYRTKHGEFTNIDDLLKIKGMTKKNYRQFYFRLVL